jgi:hypothetical protein
MAEQDKKLTNQKESLAATRVAEQGEKFDLKFAGDEENYNTNTKSMPLGWRKAQPLGWKSKIKS